MEGVAGKARDRGSRAMRIENTNGRLPKAVRGAGVCRDGDPVAVGFLRVRAPVAKHPGAAGVDDRAMKGAA